MPGHHHGPHVEMTHQGIVRIVHPAQCPLKNSSAMPIMTDPLTAM
jgi:hypothetical protein